MRKYLKFIALSLLAAALLVWFAGRLDWQEVSSAIRHADWRLIALAVLCVGLTYFLRSLRWRALLAPLAPEASLREIFAATTVGFSAVFLVGRAGEIVRPAFLPLRDRRVRPSAAFVTIAVERVYDMAAIVLMFAANLLVFRPPAGEAMAALGRVRQAGLLLLIGAAVGIALLIWFSRHAEKVNARLDGWVGNGRGIVRRAARLLIGLLDQLARSLGVLTDARALVVTVGLTALLWMSIALASLSVMRAFGLDFNLSTAIFVLGWSLVGSLVPTPGGAAGTFHAATAAGLLFLGVGQTQAAAISIVLHLVMFGTALLFGLYYFLRSDVSLASLRRLAANEARRDEGDESSDEAPPDAASYREAGALSPNELPSSGEDNNEMSVLRLSRR